VCTLNAARILDAACRILGKTHDEVGQLALAAQPGAHGLTLLPYFEGERTPNRPKATGVFAGMNLSNSNQEDIARAMVEGMLAGLADAVDSLVALGVGVNRILLIGGAAKNPAVPVPAGEYVANGAAKQAAWALLGEMPSWDLGEVTHHSSAATPDVMTKYKELKVKTQDWT
jgi:xylulokinase